ncbi:MAG: tetratricopeptide repeat protein [Planctomycetes bacterium]|nr:tetratricopeptide repeat protein [Planctomycetota bacterium]
MPTFAAVLRTAGAGGLQAPDATAAPGAWPSFWAWATTPGVVEVVLAAGVVAAVFGTWWQLARLVRGADSRRALEDYLLGVEQALHGDFPGARERLRRVLESDPENHYARLLLGKVLAALGEPEAAHREHLTLQRGFAIDSPENELLLAASLLAAGRPTEAAAAAELALQRLPDRAEGFEFVYRARLQGGEFEAAAATGRRLLGLVPDGPRRRELGADLARTWVQVGNERLQRGDVAAAGAALRQATSLHPAAAELPLLAARLDAAQQGAAAAARARLAAATEHALVVGARDPLPAPHGLPVATLAGLVPARRWTCRACAAPLEGAVDQCGRCGAGAPAQLAEPALVVGLPSPTQTMDAIDRNDAHVQRLVRGLLDGDGEPRAAARRELLELGARAVEELLRQAWPRSGAAREAAVELLRAMGPSITPALFAASDELERQRMLPIGSRSPAELVGRVVQGFDRSALPHIASLFASARPQHRKVLIDFFLGLADLDAFQSVLERFPPLEILHRLNKADGAVLRRFFQAVPRGHFVAETLLVEPAFYREDELLAAIPGAADPEVLQATLRRRGSSRTLSKALIAATDDAALAGIAEQLLVDLGPAVVDHVLAAYTDLERSDTQRQRLGAVLARLGAEAVEDLCASFGPEPSALDDQLRGVLVAIGEAAVRPLQDAYERSGWLERITAGMVARHTNRRAQIVQTLQRLGSPAAVEALAALREAERDPNLRLRLEQALHALAARPREEAP